MSDDPIHPATRPSRAGSWRAILLAAALVIAACSREGSPERPEARLQPIPAPSLTAAEPAVRQQLEGKLAEVDALLVDRRAGPAGTAQALGDLGLLYILYDFLDAAEACFVNAEMLSPQDSRWPYLRGYLLQVQGRLAETTGHFERALELDPSLLPAQLRLGRARLELGELGPARERFSRALELDPRSAPALEGLGKVAEAEGNPEEAVAYFERALELAPEATSLRYALGQSYRRLGRIEEAQEQLALGGDGAVRISDPLLNPLADLGQSAQFYLMQAATAMDSQRWEVATAAWERAIELDPDQIDGYRGLSFCLEKLGDLDGALEQLTRGLDRARRNPELLADSKLAEMLRLRGGLEVLLERDGEAAESFRASLAALPDQPIVRSKLANALARLGRPEEAIAELDRLLTGDPAEAPSLLVQRATLWVNLGRKKEAVADFERALELAPGNPVIRQRYAAALEFLGDAAAARAQRSKLGSAPGAGAVPGTDAEQAARFLTEGRFEEAAASFRRALTAAPERLDLRYELAQLLGHLGRFDESIEEFRRVLTAAPDHAGAHVGLVTALVLASRWAETREQLQVALKLFPRNLELAMLQTRVLASAPDPRVRNGAFALELARRINDVNPNLQAREVLALAHAQAGQFGEAARIQRGVLAEAEGSVPPPTLARLRAELAAFESRRAWIVASPQELLDSVFAGG